MVLHGQIEKAVRQELKDKTTGQIGHLWQVVVSDKTKPSAYRSSTFFVTYLTDDKFYGLFPTPVEAEDAQITILAGDLAPANAMIKVKGTVLKGWQTTEQLARLAEALAADAKVSGVTVERPKAKA
ncbi:MAG: hypothetical protein JNM99_06070 [Verrucomicrobiaceae bacterium]|nr:hypothetical protein [Verrucomicrobiaceae bacterium]